MTSPAHHRIGAGERQKKNTDPVFTGSVPDSPIVRIGD